MPMPALLLCLVVGIADGDTLVVRCEAQAGEPARRITVRLAQIDAPERGQPFGDRSRRHLAGLCHRKHAEIRPSAIDPYGRAVASVRCGEVDAATEQVRAGLAWVFDRYAKEAQLYVMQADAREKRRGLWSRPGAVAPWEWRGGR